MTLWQSFCIRFSYYGRVLLSLNHSILNGLKNGIVEISTANKGLFN